MSRGRKPRVAMMVDPFEDLKAKADKLITEIGFYMHRVDQLLGRGLGPSTTDLDDAIGEVARVIYRDDEAA